jgi:ketosteroid isomerase-like protein
MERDVAAELIEMERAALTRWGKGDPGGFLEISAPDVVYFDPYVPRRVDGREALTECYRPIWGKIRFERFELLNPQVQASGDMAVLTFNYVSYTGEGSDRWNCTEVYRRSISGVWQIIQTHWSYTEVFKFKMPT